MQRRIGQRCSWTTRPARVYRRLHGVPRPRAEPQQPVDAATQLAKPVKKEGASTDIKLIAQRTWKLVRPYWVDNPDATKVRIALGGVVFLSLCTTGVSVVFSFLGRDFFNALSSKNETTFYAQLVKYLAGFAIGIPVFVFRDYFTGVLSLRWREWMTNDLLSDYMSDRTFYNVNTGQVIDNPDQRLTSDINNFTSTSLSLAFTFLTSLVDLVSFSGILFSIYPPLFGALIVYALGGTVVSFAVGKPLVGLNFRQEATEADLRYGLVRVRENAESIAFYRGASSEVGLLAGRLGLVVQNYGDLLKASRNLDFFQSAYRYIIILLPAAVVAPLFFRGEIEFGVVNQSQSAFSHILSDVSLIVYQFEALAGYSAVVDRLGEFQEAVEAKGKFRGDAGGAAAGACSVPVGSEISLVQSSGDDLVRLSDVTLCTPNYENVLFERLSLSVARGERLLVMGPSGCGKTSLLRALGGLWTAGTGSIEIPPVAQVVAGANMQGMMFVPQRPYMVLGSLRQQLLYPAYNTAIIAEALDTFDDNGGNLFDPAQSQPLLGLNGNDAAVENGAGTGGGNGAALGGSNGVAVATPSDVAMRDAMEQVGLAALLQRCSDAQDGEPLDRVADWSTMLSLGEQQRLAFARVLLANPALVLLDESTSALDLANEARLYGVLIERGTSVVSVGHRDSLKQFHERQLELGEDGPKEVALPAAVAAP